MPMGKGKYPDLHAAIDKLHPGEPCFLLRAQDLIAPKGVMSYAYLLQDLLDDKQGRDDVLAFADSMIAWQMANPTLTKNPD